jgi:xylulokinase
MLVAGVDSSTQSTKVLLCRAGDGAVVGRGSAPHPGGTECDPAAWWTALQQAGEGLLGQAAAVGVAGQQHGMVALDSDGEVVRPALLWNDLRSAGAAAALVAERGPQWWARETGSVPNASFTVTKLRWLAEHEPAHAARVAGVLLPHDWVSWRLRGGLGERARAALHPGAGPRMGPPADVPPPCTDRGEASGTGYFSPAAGAWLPEVAAAALGHPLWLPRIAGPAEVTGETGWGAAVSAGTGDNMSAALGLGLQPGEVAVSVGTSGTAFAVAAVPAADATGAVAGFADATGRFLPLVCTVNAGLVLDSVARLIGTDGAGLAQRALAAAPGAGGLTLLPYFDGERTPDRPLATGALRGATTRNLTPENLARAAVEGVLASLASVAGLLGACGADCQRVLLIGGAARSEAIRVIAPGVFGVPVEVPEPEEYVALGAARQAAWALAGTPGPPDWPRPPAKQYTGPARPDLLQRFAELRDATVPWDGTVPWDRQ